MNSPVKIIRPAEDDRLFDVATFAAERSMHVVTDGDDVIVCSVIPVGWRKMAVKFRQHDATSVTASSSGHKPDADVIQRFVENLI